MKMQFVLFLCIVANIAFAQTIEKISIPNGIVYQYVSDQVNDQVKDLITKGLSLEGNDDLLGERLMIGPSLWQRYRNIESLQSIEGNVIFHIDDMEVDGKVSQKIEDSRRIWNELKKEISRDFQIRKANEAELNYYWSTISFDIEEPLLIVETEQRKFILNFLKKSMKLFWVDELPIRNTYENPIDKQTYKTDGYFKSYKNGKEVYSADRGQKETNLEKVIFMSSDDELKRNTSIEDITSVIDKTSVIFDRLFKNSEKSGKIMIQFELGKKKNEIQFAVRDDLDLDIMKEFEKQINSEKYPHSRKDNIKFQLIYKVNSYNDTE